MMLLLLVLAASDPLADFKRERSEAKAPAAELVPADALAAEAEAAAKAGDFVAAARLAREARWLLPAPPAGLPEHVRRVFGAGRLRHAGRVNALAYFPDGIAVVSASEDGTVRIWNLLNGREKLTYRGHVTATNRLKAAALAISPDGKTIASAGGSEIHLWDAATGERKQTLTGGHVEPVKGLAYSPDGTSLAAGDDKGRLVVWDVVGGKPRASLPDQRRRIEGVAVNGKLIATVNLLGELALFELASPGKGAIHITSPDDGGKLPLFAVAAAGDALLVGGKDRQARLYAATGTLIRTLSGHSEAVLTVAADAAGTILVTAGEDGTVRAWETATGKPLRILQGHPGAVTAVAVRPDGKEIISGGEDGSLRVWPLSATDAHRSVPLSAPGFALVAGELGMVAGGLDGSVRLIDPVSGKVGKELIGHTAGVAAACFIGNQFATGGGDTLIKRWDVATGKATDLAGHTSTVLALVGDGDRLISGSADRTVRGWQLSTGKPLWTWTGPSAVCAIAVMSSHRLVVGTADGSLTLLDTSREPKVVGETVAHGHGVLGVAARSDGSLLATAGGDGLVRLWRPSTTGFFPVGRIEPPARSGSAPPAAAVAFAPDGRLLAIASGDLLRVWDTATGAEMRTLRGFTDSVTAVAFTPDGRTVAATGADKTLRLFPLPRSDARPPAHTGPVAAIALSPDAKTLATGSEDKTVKLWDTSTGKERMILADATDAVGGVGFAANGEVVVASADGRVRWYGPDGKEHRSRPTHRTFALGVAADGTAQTAWQLRSGAEPVFGFDVFTPKAADKQVTIQGQPVTCAAVAATTARAVSGGSDGTIRLWNLTTGARVGDDWQLSNRPLADVQLTPDGNTLLALDSDGIVTVAVIDGRTKKTSVRLPGAGGLAVAADRFATYSPDGLVVAFGLEGKELRRWPLPGPVSSVAFAADGKTLAVGNADGTAYLLELP